MSEHIVPITYRHKIVCSISNCTDVHETPTVNHERVNQFRLARDHANEVRKLGWRVFVGRSRRWYCPAHGPLLPTNMWEDKGR